MANLEEVRVAPSNFRRDHYTFKPHRDALPTDKQSIEARMKELNKAFGELKIAEEKLELPIVSRKVECKDTLEATLLNFGQVVRGLEAMGDLLEQKCLEVSRDIPKVRHQDRATVPDFVSAFGCYKLQLFELREKIIGLRHVLEDDTFLKTFELLKAKMAHFDEISTNKNLVDQVATFERELAECQRYYNNLPELPVDRIRFEVLRLLKEIFLLLEVTSGELHTKISQKKKLPNQAALLGRLNPINQLIRDHEKALNEILGRLEARLAPTHGAPRLLDASELSRLIANTRLNGYLSLNPVHHISRFSYWGGWYADAVRICEKEMPTVAKGVIELGIRMDKLTQQLATRPAREALVNECSELTNLATTLDAQLKIIIEGKDARKGLCQTEYNKLVNPLLQHADILVSLLLHFKQMLHYIQILSNDAYDVVQQAKATVTHYLTYNHDASDAPRDSLERVLLLYQAVEALNGPMLRIARESKLQKKEMDQAFSDEELKILAETLSHKGKLDLQLTPDEAKVFENVIRLLNLDALQVVLCSYVAKRIITMTHFSRDAIRDIELELVLFVLRRQGKRFINDDRLGRVLQKYDQISQGRRLPDDILDRASYVFKFIYDTLSNVSGKKNPKAFGRAWQTYFELENIKNDSDGVQALKELARQKLVELAKRGNYFPIPQEVLKKSLLDYASNVDEINAWPDEHRLGLLLRSLYAVHWAHDQNEQKAAKHLIAFSLENEKNLGPLDNYADDFYQLLFEHIHAKIIALDNVGKYEILLFRTKGPIRQFSENQAIPLKHLRYTVSHRTVILHYEKCKNAEPNPEYLNDKPVTKALFDALGPEEFKAWYMDTVTAKKF